MGAARWAAHAAASSYNSSSTHAADLYGDVLASLGLPEQAVLAMSCFAVTDVWTPSALAVGTRYRHYHHTTARTITAVLGRELWPSDTYDGDGEADPRNAVHFDLVIGRGIELADLADRTSADADARRALRERLLGDITPILNRFEGPTPLP